MNRSITGHGEVKKVLEDYDVSHLVGFQVRVRHAARVMADPHGDEWIEVPREKELQAAAAMVRCLMAIKLKGSELRAIRHIVGWTAEELAKKLDARASFETISRWENDKQQMGGYAEKVFRLNVCEALKRHAPGVDYNAGNIASLVVVDPWMTNAEHEVPYVTLDLVRMKQEDKKIAPSYTEELSQAA